MPLTREDEQELNELAQLAHCWLKPPRTMSVDTNLLVKLLDEYARLKIEVEALRQHVKR